MTFGYVCDMECNQLCACMCVIWNAIIELEVELAQGTRYQRESSFRTKVFWQGLLPTIHYFTDSPVSYHSWLFNGLQVNILSIASRQALPTLYKCRPRITMSNHVQHTIKIFQALPLLFTQCKGSGPKGMHVAYTRLC